MHTVYFYYLISLFYWINIFHLLWMPTTVQFISEIAHWEFGMPNEGTQILGFFFFSKMQVKFWSQNLIFLIISQSMYHLPLAKRKLYLLIIWSVLLIYIISVLSLLELAVSLLIITSTMFRISSLPSITRNHLLVCVVSLIHFILWLRSYLGFISYGIGEKLFYLL